MRSAPFALMVGVGVCFPVVSARPFESQTAPAKAESPASSQTATSVPAPSQEVQALTKALAGQWKTREKYEATGPTPQGGVGEGDLIWRSGPGGFTLLEEYRAKTPIGELFGFGLVWWDHVRGLQHMWCINVNPGGCEMFPPPPRPGPKWDGKHLLLDTEVELAGRKYVWHEVISVTSVTSFAQTVDIGETGGAMKRWMTSDATRVAN